MRRTKLGFAWKSSFASTQPHACLLSSPPVTPLSINDPAHPNNSPSRLFLHGKPTFFRRDLPPPCIELSSPQGTQLFTESLLGGHATSFFRLIEQLHTQNEPEYCGLASLVTVLNALEVDPKRIWKGNWRFFSEELLSVCEPLQKVKSGGINFDKLARLAKCNGLHVEAYREASLETFTHAVRQASTTSSSCLILAYARSVLGQTGGGHYSPMGAYHPESNQILILDCARFKYRPHWAPLELVHRAMQVVDEEDTKKPRGYMVMSPTFVPPDNAIVFKLCKKPTSAKFDIWGESVEWKAIHTLEELLTRLVNRLAQSFEVVIRETHCEHHQVSHEDALGNDRKKLVLDQLALVEESWETRRDRVVLLLAFLGVNHVWEKLAILGCKPHLLEELRSWVDVERGKELEVELRLTREQMERFLIIQE